MKCPTCVAEGKRSRVYGGPTPTPNLDHHYFDEDGVPHVHDPHQYKWARWCSNGHEWLDERWNSCPECGWTNGPTKPGPLEVKTEASDVVAFGPGVPSEPTAAEEFRAADRAWVTPDSASPSDEVVSGQPQFQVLDAYKIEGRGIVILTELDRQCHDFRWLVGHKVNIGGIVYRCKGVEHHCTPPPYSPGDRIGILVDELEDDDG